MLHMWLCPLQATSQLHICPNHKRQVARSFGSACSLWNTHSLTNCQAISWVGCSEGKGIFLRIPCSLDPAFFSFFRHCFQHFTGNNCAAYGAAYALRRPAYWETKQGGWLHICFCWSESTCVLFCECFMACTLVLFSYTDSLQRCLLNSCCFLCMSGVPNFGGCVCQTRWIQSRKSVE